MRLGKIGKTTPGESSRVSSLNVRKAAILLTSLPQEEAAHLMSKLKPKQVETVSIEIAKLGRLMGDEQEAVLNEFADANPHTLGSELGGLDAAKALVEKALGKGAGDTLDNVRKASDIAIHAGADFIKTSTGKIQPAATMPVTLCMLEAIRDYYYQTGKMIGMKPAGGISKAKAALHYLVMLNEVLGEDWMNNHWFRFGASSLANDVLMQLVKEKTGVYQSGDYFSID